jgi:hypothetical protein
VNTGLEEEEYVIKILCFPTNSHRGPQKGPDLGKWQPLPHTEAPDQVSRKSHSYL